MSISFAATPQSKEAQQARTYTDPSAGAPPSRRSGYNAPYVDLGHWNKVFTDQNYFDSIAKQKGMTEGAKVSLHGDDYVYRQAMIGYLADTRKVPLDDMRSIFDAEKDGFAKTVLGKQTASAREMFDWQKGQFERSNEKKAAADQILQGVIRRSLEDALSGGDTPFVESVGKDINAASEMFDDEEKSRLWERAEELDMKIRASQDRFAPEARFIFDALQQSTGQKTGFGAPDMREMASRFAQLPDNQRKAIYELAGGFAQITQTDKGFWYQMAESLGRGASDIVERVPRNFREQTLRGQLRLLNSEQPVFRATGVAGAEFSAAGSTPVFGATQGQMLTPEEREEAKAKIQSDLGVLKVERELRDLAERVVDPIKTVTFLPEIVEEGLYGAARSIPYTAAAAVPFVGVPAVASALFSSNYDRIMLEYPDLDPDKAAIIAAISAPIEAGLERMKVNTITGRLPVFGGLVKRLQHPNQRNITRIAIGGAGIVAEQNVQEIVQNATFPFVQTIAAALDADMPDYDWEERLAGMPRELAVQFVALLPLSLMGVGALSYREISRGENYLKSKADLEKAGYNEEQIDRITGAESAEAAQAALVEEHAKRDPKLVKAAAQRIVDESIALREKANPAALPRLEKQGADYTVLSPEGKELARTTDQTAAEQALVSARRETVQREMRDVHTGINEAVAFIQKVNEARQRGEDVAKVIREEAPRTLLTDYEANPTQENLDRLFETVRAFGQDINEPAELANFPVTGSNQGALREGIWRSIIRINEGADGTIVMREFAQDNLKRAMAEGRVTIDFVRQQLNDILPQIDSARMERQLRTETDTDVIEAFSDVALAYFRGQIREEQIPAGLRGIMRRLAIFTRDIFRRAYNLARLRAEGKLDRDFEALLAEAVGVDQQALVDRARKKTAQEVAPDGRGADGLTDDERFALEQELQAEMERDAAEAAGEGGIDILDAVREAGGLPAKTSSKVYQYSGELQRIREASKGGNAIGVKGVFNLFRKNAPDLDALIKDLQTMGFNQITTPSDLFDMVERRIMTGRPIYGYEAAATARAMQNYSIAAGEAQRGADVAITLENRVASSINGVPRADIFETAKRRFGVTQSLYEAGYVLPDGTMLDFSGRADAGYVQGDDLVFRPRSGERDYMQDQRGTDHREIEWNDMPRYTEIWASMTDFLRLGAIRIDGNSGMISMHSRARPTSSQARVLKDLVVAADGAYVDLEDDLGNKTAMMLESAKWPRVQGLLERWANGETPAVTQNYSIGSRAQPDVERNVVTLPDVTISGPANYSIGAWHGSPAEFDEFDLGKVGTGEGAQVYGWGLYFAENEEVAKNYKDAGVMVSPRLRMVLDSHGGDLQKSIRAIQEAIDKNENGGKPVWDPVLQEAEAKTQRAGNMYRLSIDVEPDELLDWDLPLTQQSEMVKSALGRYAAGDDPVLKQLFVDEVPAAYMGFTPSSKGSQIYNTLMRKGEYPEVEQIATPEELSKALMSEGIKGIRYLDQGSRTSASDINRRDELRKEVPQLRKTLDSNPPNWEMRKQFEAWLKASEQELNALEKQIESAETSPTYNYVIFDDSLIKILTRNGEQISVEQAAQEVQNYSISTQSEIDRVQAAMDRLARSPSERISQYAALKERLAAALERNKPIMQSMRGDMLPQDFDRTRILNDLGFLDYILKVLPPEVRGRVGGYTNLASIAPVDVYKGDQKVSEAKNPAGAIISAWMREGQNIGQAQKNTALPEGYSTVPNTTDERRDKTIANFLIDRLKKIDRELERYYKRDLMERIFDVLDKSRPKAGQSGVKRSTLGAETQKFADMVYRSSLLDDEKTAERLAAIEAQITSTEATADSQKRISELSEEWTIVNTFGDLKSRPSETLAYGLEWLQTQLKAGREAWQIKEAARIQENRERAAKVIAFLGKPTDFGRFENKSALQRFLQAVNAFDLDHKSFEQFAPYLFGDEVAAELSKKMQRAQIDEAKLELENTRSILAALRQGAKAAGMSTSKALVAFKENQPYAVRKMQGRKVRPVKISIELAKKIVRGLADRSSLSQADVQTLADELAALPRDTRKENVTIQQVIFRGEEVRLTMSRAQAMQLWLTWQQSDAQEKMRADGFTDDSFDDLDNLISGPFAQAILRVTSRIYGSGYALTNPIYARMFGMNMPMVRNYAPARYLSSKEVKDVGLDGSPLTAGGQPSFAKSRVNHTAKLAPEDALTVLQSHIAMQSHWVAFAEVTREYRSLLSNPDVRESIRQRLGADVLRTAEMWGDQMEQRGGNKGREIAWINNMLGAVIGGQSVSLLGYNLKSLMMQTDNLMRFTLALDSRQIGSALSDPVALMQNVRKVWKTDIIQTRLEGGATAETRFFFERFVSMFRRGAKVAEMSMMPMNYLDSAGLSVSGAIVYQAAYKDALDSGVDPTSAERAAKDAVEAMVYRYGQPVLMGQKSNIENSGNAFTKAFFLFMSDPRLKMAIISDSVRGLATGRGDWKTHVRRIVAIEMMAVVSHVLATAFRDATSDDDDEDLWSMGGFARALLLAPFQGYFLLGSVSDLVLSRLTEAQWFTPTQNPLIRTADTALRAFNNLDDAFNFDDPDALVKEWTNITRSIAVMPPLAAPAVIMNIVRPLVQGWERMDDDE
jgi:hypothetical protein